MTSTTLKIHGRKHLAATDPGLSRGLQTLRVWLARARQRRHLAGLDYPQLKDIGVSRADALQEATKPFWQD